MTVGELKDKLKDMPANIEVVTHIKVKSKYIVVPIKDATLDVSGVVGLEG